MIFDAKKVRRLLQEQLADMKNDRLPSPQQSLANKLGYTQSMISGWANGSRDITFGLVNALSEHCDLSNYQLGIKSAGTVHYEARVLYVTAVENHGTDGVIGTKYGIHEFTKSTLKRVEEINREKLCFRHNLVAACTFKDKAVARAMECAIKERYGQDPHGEYCWVSPQEVFKFIQANVYLWQHEMSVAPNWKDRLGIR